MAKYTFLVPAYKPDFLDIAIGSMLSQSFEDFNIIISNDCSPYDLKSIVDRYKDIRITYRENPTNIGGYRLVDHWNKLVELCDSPYLIIAADDDIYDSNFLADVDNKCKEYPQVDVIRTRTCRINGVDDVIDIEGIFDSFGNEVDAIYNSFCSNQIWCVGNYVFKTETLKHKGGFIDFPYAWFSDLATALMMSRNGICYTTHFGFKFRLSETNISSSKKNKLIDRQKLLATIEFGEWLSDFIKEIEEPTDILSIRRKTSAIHNAKNIIYSQIGDYGWSIGYLDFIKIYRRISKWPDFSKGSFVKNYTLAALARKIGKYV